MNKNYEGGFDLHGHTTSMEWWRGFDIVNMSPEQMVTEAKKTGLDGVAITDHNTIRGLDRALNAAAKEGIIVVPGAEITAHYGINFPHILTLGLDPEIIKNDPLPHLKDPETVIKWVHDHGGIAVATHPSEHGGKFRERMPFKDLKRLAPMFDAIQTHNIQHGINQGAVEIAEKQNRPKIGGSDFHVMGQVGIVRTKIFNEAKNWQDVVEAIKQGKTEPFFRQDIPEEMIKNYDRKPILLKTAKEKIKSLLA
ncbi:MAG: PHP domain protein [Candidatus Magasanikbacteria bacterium GW2011_GWC2_34_16]|uniref:PHP domain protein n=1 Tax=Candidatus Magasanikbacteria bacterium GW2011_GWC2_34_16 TaxID=1619045 RepID=A0A0G0DWP5_9BACT|nr:MAG: PHP domain protein [Candidatus Magasanikbacteria bacterium GW2011_GWC2_34_16]